MGVISVHFRVRPFLVPAPQNGGILTDGGASVLAGFMRRSDADGVCCRTTAGVSYHDHASFAGVVLHSATGMQCTCSALQDVYINSSSFNNGPHRSLPSTPTLCNSSAQLGAEFPAVAFDEQD